MGYLEGVGRVSEGVLRLSGGCLDGVWGCLRPPEYCQGVLVSTKVKKVQAVSYYSATAFSPSGSERLKMLNKPKSKSLDGRGLF